ncbi:hypothetical protein KCP76_23355 [Salmonella enterica subsp. enterica serovar Weltevreden]|nr:hypothetical protein KCP76_23355 [Salmonella enterica subsp. enterica serovar Weltevreden]
MRVGRTSMTMVKSSGSRADWFYCWSRRFRLRGCWWVNNLLPIVISVCITMGNY